MTTLNSIPVNEYATREKAAECGYVLLDEDMKNTLLIEYGHMAALGDDFATACDIADEQFSFSSPIGYVIAFDPTAGEFVAFSAVNDIKIITTHERAIFDAIVDEARSTGSVAVVTDGVARINDGFQTTIARLVAPNEDS